MLHRRRHLRVARSPEEEREVEKGRRAALVTIAAILVGLVLVAYVTAPTNSVATATLPIVGRFDDSAFVPSAPPVIDAGVVVSPVALAACSDDGFIEITGNISFNQAVLSTSRPCSDVHVVGVPNFFRGTIGAPGADTYVCVRVPRGYPVTFTPTVRGTLRLLGSCDDVVTK